MLRTLVLSGITTFIICITLTNVLHVVIKSMSQTMLSQQSRCNFTFQHAQVAKLRNIMSLYNLLKVYRVGLDYNGVLVFVEIWDSNSEEHIIFILEP